MPTRKPRAQAHREKSKDQEQAIQDALAYLHSRPTNSALNMKRTAAKFGVPRTTLRARFLGKAKPRRLSHERQQLLTHAQERVLSDWIIFLGFIACPLSKQDLRWKVNELCGRKPSDKWVRSFRNRHPELKFAKPSGLDPKRAQAFNRPAVERMFQELSQLMARLGIEWNEAWNVDEKGVQEGGGRRQRAKKFIMANCPRPCYKLQSANLELVTVIECVCADGSSIKPAFIFPGKNQFCTEWFEVENEIGIGLSENGWTNERLCLKWFQQSFLPQTKSRREKKPLLLIVDGHGSHITPEMREEAVANNVHIFQLPPHTTHRLQPLDVGVFGPFQRAWQDRCDYLMAKHNKGIPREDFVSEYMGVRERSFTEHIIQKAWKKSGLAPLDLSIFTDADFAPSVSTSTTSNPVPESFIAYAKDDLLDILENDRADDDDDGDDESDGSDDECTRAGEDFEDDWTSEDGLGEDDDVSLDHVGRGVEEEDDERLTVEIVDGVQEQGREEASASDEAHASKEQPLPSQPPADPEPNHHRDTVNSRPRRKTLESDVQALRERIAHLEERVSALSSQLEASKTHNTLALGEMRRLQQKNNAQKKKRKPKYSSDSGWITSDSGLKSAREEKEQRMAAENAKIEERKRREDKAAERQRARELTSSSTIFTGALSRKTKEDLLDIAHALGLQITDKKAPKVKVLLEMITEHFNSHPDLKISDQFSGLFGRQRSRLATSSTALSEPLPSSSSALYSHPQPVWMQPHPISCNIPPTTYPRMFLMDGETGCSAVTSSSAANNPIFSSPPATPSPKRHLPPYLEAENTPVSRFYPRRRLHVTFSSPHPTSPTRNRILNDFMNSPSRRSSLHTSHALDNSRALFSPQRGHRFMPSPRRLF